MMLPLEIIFCIFQNIKLKRESGYALSVNVGTRFCWIRVCCDTLTFTDQANTTGDFSAFQSPTLFGVSTLKCHQRCYAQLKGMRAFWWIHLRQKFDSCSQPRQILNADPLSASKNAHRRWDCKENSRRYKVPGTLGPARLRPNWLHCTKHQTVCWTIASVP